MGQAEQPLAEAGSASGVSRERIRQVEKRARDMLRGILFVPALDRAIEALNSAAMDFESDGSTCLRNAGLVSADFMPAGLVTAAEIFGREIEFEVRADGRGLLVPGTGSDAFASVIRGLSDQNYVISLQEVAARLEKFEEPAAAENMARQWVPNLPNAVRLDAAGGVVLDPTKGWSEPICEHNPERPVCVRCDQPRLTSRRVGPSNATPRECAEHSAVRPPSLLHGGRFHRLGKRRGELPFTSSSGERDWGCRATSVRGPSR